MARPERNNVDYFPFLCKEGKSMRFIQKKHGNDGYATWVKILRQLAITDYHHLDLSKEEDVMDLSAICDVSEEKLFEIINDLCRLNQFDKELWDTKVLYNQKFVDAIQDAYKKRNNECITRDGVILMLAGGTPNKGTSTFNHSKDNQKPEKKPADGSLEHQLFPQHKSVEQWFIDLENGSEIVELARIHKLSVEVLKTKIEPFKKAAELSYPNYGLFVRHFKNWVLKGTANNSGTSKPVKLT